MDFANNLKKYRKQAKILQSDMATILGISERGYRNYELGSREPTIAQLCVIADALNVSLDALVGRDFPKDSLMDSE